MTDAVRTALAADLVASLAPIVRRVRTDITAVKRPGAKAYTWARDEALTRERLTAHVAGGLARGVCPIREGESTTRVAVLDFDSHKGECPWDALVEVVDRVAAVLEMDGYAPIAWRSTGGHGVHLYLLWDEPQDAYSVRQTLVTVLDACGLTNGTRGVAHGQVEVFPKQDAVEIGGCGNMFILPLAGQSAPLEPLLGYLPMPREDAVRVQWTVSERVPVIAHQVVAALYESEPDEIARVREALTSIPVHASHDEWFRVMCAVHEATGGSQDGLDLFDEWSAQGQNYDARTLQYKWGSLSAPGSRRSAITRASLYHEAQSWGWGSAPEPDTEGFDDVGDADVGEVRALAVAQRLDAGRERHAAIGRWRQALAESPDDLHLREIVCSGIAADSLIDKLSREMLADCLKQRFAVLGVKLPIAACRKLLTPVVRLGTPERIAEWAEDWVYITDEDRFYRKDSEEFLTAQGFNAKFNRELPPQKEGELPRSAHRVALDEMQLPTVTRGVYLPNAADVFQLNGVECVNLYRPSSTPVAASTLSDSGKAAVALVTSHLALLTGGREQVTNSLLYWMAHNVQHPGKKIRWAPLIKGIEGDGKTLIGRVMAAVMGEANVKDISPKVLGTDFTGWAHKACVGVLEEIRLTGHSRHDIHNALKPFITNNTVPIHAKGRDEFTTINTMNYIAFTNHADALPLNDTDRRFFVVFTKFQQIADLQKVVGNLGEYFTRLYQCIENHREELRRWLLDVQIPTTFAPDGRAPETKEKEAMVDMGVSHEEDVINAVIEKGGIGISIDIVVVNHLIRAIRAADGELKLDHRHINKPLARLGWTRFPQQIKWRGEVCRVWYKNLKPENDASILRPHMDATLMDANGQPLVESDF